jgi:hypothetical protein
LITDNQLAIMPDIPQPVSQHREHSGILPRIGARDFQKRWIPLPQRTRICAAARLAWALVKMCPLPVMRRGRH